MPDTHQPEPLRMIGVSRDPSQAIAVVAFNRPMTSDELLAFNRLLRHYMPTASAPVTTTGGGEV
jgi:hypothetical protein